MLHLGTSSWSSDDWKAAGFYPAEMEPRDYLGHYARRFGCVEVDSSFYRSPSPSMCARWYGVVPAGFRFALKVPKAVTHDKALAGAEAEWGAFLRAAACLKEKLGFLVLQFPYFNRQSACPSLGAFLERLGAFLSSAAAPCPLVVEVRNKAWVGKELLEFLRERKAVFAITHQEWMPAPPELWEKYGEALLTGPAAYLRFLGERERIEKITTRWEKLVIDRTEETRRAVRILRSLLALKAHVYAFLNNHFAGYAVGSMSSSSGCGRSPPANVSRRPGTGGPSVRRGRPSRSRIGRGWRPCRRRGP